MEDAVGIDQELYFDARQTCRHGWNAFEIKTGQRAAIFRQFALPLHHVDGHVGLAFYSGGELFGGRGRNRAVALDNLGHYAAQSFDAQRERSHVEQQHVFGGC